MKRLLYSIFALAAIAAAAVSCSKESESITPVKEVRTHTVTIKAGLAPETRTAYDGEGKFSWVEGDKIGVVVSNGEEKKVVSFSTTGSGAVVEFSGEVEEGFEPTGIATYPYTEITEGYACNDFVYDPAKDSYRIWGSVKPSLETPLASNPLAGMADQWGVFQFRSAMGAVKFTVENVREDVAYLYLEIPEEAEGALNGWFTLDEEGTVTMANATEGWKDRYNWNVPAKGGDTVEYYFYIPVGTIPAGLKVELRNSSWAAIQSFTTVQPIEVLRNTVTNVAAIRMDDPPFSLDDVFGTYQMKVTGGSYSTNKETGDCVFEASDNPEKGDVMLTKFAGISGKQYGKLVGDKVIFDKEQVFGANPYEATAGTYDKIALDSHNGSTVVDVEFELVEPHYLKFTGVNLGFRATTDQLWLENEHNGAWPWSLCFGSVELKPEWPEEAPELEPGQVWVKESMITAVDSCPYAGDNGGAPALVDGDTSTHWHSNYYGAITNNDPVYGLYFDIALTEPLQKFHFAFITRQANSNAAPTHIVYGVSNDGENWTKLTTEDDSGATKSSGGGVRFTLSNLDAGAEYKYIRFGITDSTNSDPGSFTIVGDEAAGGLDWTGYKKCANMAELMLFAD